MGLQIEDGTGDGPSAGVTARNRLKVDAISTPHEVVVSRDDARAFNAVCEGVTVGDGEYGAYLKNTSTTRNLFISLIRVSADGTVPILWKIHKVSGTAANGAAVTAVNLNLGSAISPEATILEAGSGTAISGLTQEGEIAFQRHGDQESANIPFDEALILPPQTAIAVELDDGGSATTEVLLRFFYEDIE